MGMDEPMCFTNVVTLRSFGSCSQLEPLLEVIQVGEHELMGLAALEARQADPIVNRALAL